MPQPVAYLTSANMLPDSSQRRKDGFEYDQSLQALAAPLKSEGFQLQPIAWDKPNVDGSQFRFAIIGTTWDYMDRPEQFMEALQHIDLQTELLNPLEMVRWNLEKTYLEDLRDKGVHCIPTMWLDQLNFTEAQLVFKQLEATDLVIKRQIGAGAQGQIRIQPGQDFADISSKVMVQPFIPSIQSEGEYSFIFIDNQFSHALVKTAKPGDYRIQSIYGGRETPVQPSTIDLNAAKSVLEVLDQSPLYARVDMVRDTFGRMFLMELELIEPFLYPVQGPQLGTLMAQALKKRR